MQPNRLTKQEYKGIIYVNNIRKNACWIRNQLKNWNTDLNLEKNHSGSTKLTYTGTFAY